MKNRSFFTCCITFDDFVVRGARDYTARAGGDIRVEVTPRLRLISTANPDFENIEQAVEGIDFSYGERYMADRRPFFSEGGNVYQLGTYFHSRRIRDMDGGVNLFGELGKNTSVGTLGTYHRHTQNVIVRASQSFSATAHLSAVFLHITGEMHRQTASALCPAVCQGKVAMETPLAQSWAGEAVGNAGDITFSYNGAPGQPCLPLFYLAIRASERNHRELKRALGHFIEYHTERRLKSLRFIESTL